VIIILVYYQFRAVLGNTTDGDIFKPTFDSLYLF